ncbi:MAG: Zn-dependent hydrolase [Candidatus Eremiobacteraeota bacterium]|nr:Zn-dependent hydrolase [Candidatus Eremiobacteraeota bacterium]
MKKTILLLVALALWTPSLADTLPKDQFKKYTTVKLTSDLSHLSPDQKKMVGELLAAAQIMDHLFWQQAYGDKAYLLESITDPELRRYAAINYGPWDRLNGDAPFLPGYGPKPLGARFYPTDMTKEEFEAASFTGQKSLYSVVRRDSNGKLVSIPYSQMYQPELQKAAAHLRAAAALAEDPGFKHYLELRAKALLDDNYQPSDMAWMDMKDNLVDLVVGPIESYEDKLYGYRTSFEAYLLVKDLDWTKKLARFASFLPRLQEGLPVPPKYKAEKPGSNSDLAAYDVVYYAGDCNAGSKTIAINLPNDEEVQLKKGSRRLQLKNAMRAKFDAIMVPIGDVLIDPAQRKHVKFDAFFANTMFHEVAHGLGIKNTLDGKSTVSDALKEFSGTLEEGKADLLGLYMIAELQKAGELPEADVRDNYVTFMAGIFRSVRFGASSAHGKANMVRFNYFEKMGAFQRDPKTGTYHVDFDKMKLATDKLSEKILTLQGDGDYEGARKMVTELGTISPQLQKDLDRLQAIPVDIIFEQGAEALGL